MTEPFSHRCKEYVFRIWILPTTDAVVTINKICLNAQPYTLKVDQLGLTDGDLLYFNMQKCMLHAKQVPYRNYGSHDKPNFIIALTGQSNSQGVGGLYYDTSKDDQPHNRVYSFNIWSKTWEMADLRKHIGTKPPLLQCLAFHFAKKLVEGYSDIRVGIINFGVDGQPISRWVKYDADEEYYQFNQQNAGVSGEIDYGQDYGNYMPGVQGDIYDAHVRNIHEAMDSIDPENRIIDVICWHQGEGNGGVSSFNERYFETSLNKVIHQYRSLEYCYSKTPFIVGETTGAYTGSYKGWEARNKELRYLNVVGDPYTKCVSSMDLEVSDSEFNNGDKIHFSSESHRILGKRYFEAFRSIHVE